jgi:hypothetical protein
MQYPKPEQERPISAYEAAMKRRTFDMNEVLGMRRLGMVTIDVDKRPEVPKAAPSQKSASSQR